MSVQELDAIIRTGKTLSEAVDALNNDHFRALTDRLGLSTSASRAQVKRALVNAGYGK